MNYNSNYNTRLSAKTHKTKHYSEEELSSVRQLIKRFLTDENPEVSLNTNEANYTALSEAINDFYGEEIISTRFVYDIYRQNSDSLKKNIRKMNAIKEFVQQHYQQKAPIMRIETISENERLLGKIEELQRDVKLMFSWMQQMSEKSLFPKEANAFAMNHSGTWGHAMYVER